MPEALWFTDDEAANRLIADDPFALLVGFALDQQVTVQQAFLGPLRLKERLGTLEPREVADADLGPLFRQKPAIHRFPGSMAERVRELGATVAEEYGGDASRLWTEAADGADLRRRISGLPGFGEMKVKSLGAVLAKRFGVPAAQELVPGHPDARGRRLAAGTRRLPGREEGAQGPVAGVEVRTLTDGGQPAEQTAHALAEFCAPRSRRSRSRSTTSGCRRSSTRSSAERSPPRRSAVSPSASPTTSTTRKQSRPAAAEHGSRRARGSAVPDRRDPGRARPHAPQVRRPRRRLGLDRVDELDGRLVDARGERHRDRRLAGGRRALPRRLRAALDDARGRRAAATSTPRRWTGCAPGSARAAAKARAPDREGDRLGPAPRPDRLAGDQLGADPRHARAGRRPTARSTSPASSTPPRSQRCSSSGTRTGTPSGRRRCCGRRSPAPLLRQGHDPVRARLGARLHAREGDRRRRPRLRRQLQPLALGRAERRERARARGSAARRPPRRLRRRGALRYPPVAL